MFRELCIQEMKKFTSFLYRNQIVAKNKITALFLHKNEIVVSFFVFDFL